LRYDNGSYFKKPNQPYHAPDAASFFPGQDMDWVYDATEVCPSVFRRFIQCPKATLKIRESERMKKLLEAISKRQAR
jgi:hypothetical protein